VQGMSAVDANVQTVSTEMGARVKIVLLNVDENPRMTRLHGIRMVPTLILFISGEERERIQGLTNRAHLSSTIEMHLQDEVDNHSDLGNAAGEGIQPALKVKEKLRPIIRPTAKPPVKFELPRDKFYAVLDLINGSCGQFERTPITFAKLDEEELRNVILSNLNSRYEFEALGEAFCKRGKTDIYLRVQEGGIFVAECKNWDGAKTINEAVSQILNYLTWRDSCGVVIVFSKRKGFSKVLEAAASHILQLPSYIKAFKRIDESHFSGSFALPEDEQKLVELHFMIYNLCDSGAQKENAS
jgi:Thioredoxin